MKPSSLFVFAVVSWAVFLPLGVFFLFAAVAILGHGGGSGGNADPIYFFLVATICSAVVSVLPALVAWHFFLTGLQRSDRQPTSGQAAARALVSSLATSVLAYATAVFLPGPALFWGFTVGVVAFSFLASFTIRNRLSVRPTQQPFHESPEHEG